MKLLVSVMALAVALAWPNVVEAQSKKSTARSGTATVQQKQSKRAKTTRVRTAAKPARSQRPCAGYLWTGCVGWDPDPNVRATLVRDLADAP